MTKPKKKSNIELLQDELMAYSASFDAIMRGICAAFAGLDARRAKTAARLERAEELLERAREFTPSNTGAMARWHTDVESFRQGEWE
jgi:hypothetical protein